MSPKLRKSLSLNPEYRRCALQGLLSDLIGECAGRVTREHALYFAGRKVQEEYAIPPICAKHHGVDGFMGDTCAPKQVRVWVALNRATDEQLQRISKTVNYVRERSRLNEKYGFYLAPPVALKDIYGT